MNIKILWVGCNDFKVVIGTYGLFDHMLESVMEAVIKMSKEKSFFEPQVWRKKPWKKFVNEKDIGGSDELKDIRYYKLVNWYDLCTCF